MYKYNDEQISELEKYKEIFPNSIEIRTIYKLAKLASSEDIRRKYIIQEIIDNEEDFITKNNIFYWQKKYQENGVDGLLNDRDIVGMYLEQCGKPLSYWNKRLLKEQLEKGITVNGEDLLVYISLTLCGDILNEQRNHIESNRSEILNKLYRKNKAYGDNQLIFIDYIEIPNKPNSLTTKIDYCFIILSQNDLTLFKCTFDRGKKLRHEHVLINGFQKVIDFIYMQEENNKIDTYIVMKETKRNSVIMDIYDKSDSNINIIVGKVKDLDAGLKKYFKELNKVRKDLLSNMETLESRYLIDKFIEKHRINPRTAYKM